jgi:hypothetical protein
LPDSAGDKVFVINIFKYSVVVKRRLVEDVDQLKMIPLAQQIVTGRSCSPASDETFANNSSCIQNITTFSDNDNSWSSSNSIQYSDNEYSTNNLTSEIPPHRIVVQKNYKFPPNENKRHFSPEKPTKVWRPKVKINYFLPTRRTKEIPTLQYLDHSSEEDINSIKKTSIPSRRKINPFFLSQLPDL